MATVETVYPNLVAEMARKGVYRKDIAALLGTTPDTVGSWMRGTNGDFSITQALKVHTAFFPTVAFKELFDRTEAGK